MMRLGVVLALPLMIGAVVAQDQPSAAPRSQTGAPNTSAQPPSERTYGPKDRVNPPRVTYQPDPTYPKKARKPRDQEVVVLWLIVGSDGLPHDIRVAHSLSPEFDKSAIDAVKKWRFDPATKDGKPVAVQINIEIHFRR